jgi:hypothetical protein
MADTPVTLAIMDAFVRQARANMPALRGASAEGTMDVELPDEQLPFLYAWELSEMYNPDTESTNQFFNRLMIRTAILFASREGADAGEALPGRRAKRLRAELEQAILADITLGGITRDMIPIEAATQDRLLDGTDTVAGVEQRSAAWMDWHAEFIRPRNDPYTTTINTVG